nr:MAG TPA: hypothetical protein [Bacteriophage sp.]
MHIFFKHTFTSISSEKIAKQSIDILKISLIM